MSFLVLVLAVWIEKFSALRQRVQRDGGWLRELARLESSARLGKQPWLILALMVLLPVALLGLDLAAIQRGRYRQRQRQRQRQPRRLPASDDMGRVMVVFPGGAGSERLAGGQLHRQPGRRVSIRTIWGARIHPCRQRAGGGFHRPGCDDGGAPPALAVGRWRQDHDQRDGAQVHGGPPAVQVAQQLQAHDPGFGVEQRWHATAASPAALPALRGSRPAPCSTARSTRSPP